MPDEHENHFMDSRIASVTRSLSNATGVCAILGDNIEALRHVASLPEVTRVFAITSRPGVVDAALSSLKAEHGTKIEHIPQNPFKVQFRDLEYTTLDFAFADLWSDPWSYGRIEEMSGLQRELRPKAFYYPWQELDIAATWIANGKSLDGMKSVHTIDTYRLETMIMVGPRTVEYVTWCRELTQYMIEAAKKTRSIH